MPARLRRYKYAPGEFAKACLIHPFTERQFTIIAGTAPNVAKREVTNILNRCEAQDKGDVAIEVYNRYFSLLNNGQPDDKVPKYSLKESQEILQSLTPWKLNIKNSELK